ncbi:cysteine hydrolase family protein, partial [Acrocarpospora corrugata]|uniref:cysteine hydrolase family protein n=1 Tax=Acrocarpospora corrugata TaxID=35763 RepID=UPI0014784911
GPPPPPHPPAPPADAAPLKPDQVVHAAGWDGFHGSDLDSVLRAAGRDLLLLAGCCLELGVHSTMRAANDRGYECLLVEDACAAAAPDLRHAALSTIEMSGGIFGAVGSTTAVATLMERS